MENREKPSHIDLLNEAFKKLDIVSEYEWRLAISIDTLARLSGNAHIAKPAEFCVPDRSTVKKQLEDIAKRSRDLASMLDDLRGPSIDALADSGFFQIIHPAKLSAVLGHLALMTESADLSAVPKVGQRKPRNDLAMGVANILANDFFALTGKRPTLVTPSISSDGHKKRGAFLSLVGDVFAALNIDAKPESFAKRAIEAFAENNQDKTGD